MAYHYARKIEVTEESPQLPMGMHWRKTGDRYMVRSDGGSMQTRTEGTQTLTEARRIARHRARQSGWAEVFRWAESATQLRSIIVATYDREVKV